MTYDVLVSQLTVNYDQSPALWDLNFGLSKGTLTGILGPNGAGKSTLLKALLGEIQAMSGRIQLSGPVAYVPQRSCIDWDFPITAIDVVMMGAYRKLGIFKWHTRAQKKRACELLEKLGMASYAERQISQLSGGQQQRLFIARALMQEADIFFLDEPFAGIDIATESLLVDLFKDLRDQGKTLLVVHHDLTTAPDYFDHLLLLNTRLIASGSVDEVFVQENLQKTYGQKEDFLERVLATSQRKSEGL
ncbi:MAG: metal ABC transporter ATP-binding protein [Simkaniaceae bacterium]|nr:metal ABC transporter ATP-binding protein [Simkaniaceae bacterium]